MTEPPGAPTILIVDEDVGFLWWLGELFNDLGYRSLPALSSPQAISLLSASFKSIDLLIIDPRLTGASHLIQVLSETRAVKVVLIQGPEPYEIRGIQAAASVERPFGRATVSRAEWRQKLQRLLLKVGIRAAS